MKKLIALFCSLTMVLGLAACGNSADSSETSSAAQSGGGENAETSQAAETSQTEETSQAEETPAPQEESSEETEDSSASTLVVYFSATGNTEQVAQYIAELTDGDLFELQPVEAYTDEDLDWTVEGSRVNLEHDDESLRNIELTADTVDNWGSYDTVFIGYPIWWGIAAWPVDGFVEANDFTGKTVIPFCTSSSSGLGESGELLAELAGSGDWQEGMRFRSGVDEADVSEWIDSLNLS